MLYPCSCPIETDGGVARRAALLKTLRKNLPNSLLLDSGGFFAGGLMDEYTQSADLDLERTKLNLKAMAVMKYDAVAVGDEEFDFGRAFLENAAKQSPAAFLSANVACPNTVPFVIKRLPAATVGIIGITPPSAGPKAGGLTVEDNIKSLAYAIKEVRAKGADIVILLSHLGESEDLALLKAVEGIDVVVSGNGRSSSPEPSVKVGTVLLLRPSWQGRRMCKAVLTLENRRLVDSQVEEIRLSDKVADDNDILSFLPECFTDGNCKRGARKGTCRNAGAKNASCEFPKDVKVPLTVVMPKRCPLCKVDKPVEFFKKQFPGLEVSYELYPGEKAEKLIAEAGIKTFPAFLFGKELERDPNFPDIKDKVDAAGNYYFFKPQYGGVAFFLGRKPAEGKIDVFLSLYDPSITVLLDTLEEFNPEIHFLAARSEDNLVTAQGPAEVEEMLRSVCVKKYYPAVFWNYLDCRVRHISSSWWEDCLGDLDGGKIKACARGQEGRDLLSANIALTEELAISSSPTYLVGNQHIFSSKQPPSKEEFRKIFSGR